MTKPSAGALLAQLVDDYLDEEQYDTAVQLVAETYSCSLRPPASILRRLLCLSLCTEDCTSPQIRDSSLNLPRHAKKVYARPTSTSVGIARELLLDLAPLSDDQDHWMPCNLTNEDGAKQWQEQKQHIETTTFYASTPLAFWADNATLYGFESIWDLLLREPTHAADRESPFPLRAHEFWMSPFDDTLHNSETDEHEGDGSARYMTQGAWRTLNVLLAVWKDTGTTAFLGSDAKYLSKMLQAAFSFEHSAMSSQDSLSQLEERTSVTVQILGLLSQPICANHASTIRQFAAIQFQTLCFSSLSLLCNMAQHLPIYKDICFTYLYMLYVDARAPAQFLHVNSKQVDVKKLTAILNIPCPFLERCKCSTSPSITMFRMTHRCLWLKWWLIQALNQVHLIKQTSVFRDAHIFLQCLLEAPSFAQDPELREFSRRTKDLIESSNMSIR